MKNIIVSLTFVFIALTISAQCDPALLNHYNVGDFPFTSSTGVTVSMGGTYSGVLGPYGPYGCSPATCDANTIRLDPGDTLIFTFSQPVYDMTFVSGVMNITENGKIISDNGIPTLTSNCPADLQITGNSFVQIGPLGSPVITVSVPGGATSISIICLPASNNGVFTVDVLDCINELSPPCGTTSSLVASSCDNYTSPSGNYIWTSTGMYNDTIPNAAGCDSVISLDLTIANSTTGTDVQTACDSYTWIDGNTYTVSNSTSTYVLGNAEGCDSVVTLNLVINTVDVSLTQAGTLLTANALGATYQWLDCPGMTLISGATSQSYNATANGNYAVIVTENGCTDTSTCYNVTGLGIVANDFGDGLILYPNPTRGRFSIDLGQNYQLVTIELMDLTGRLIQSNSYNSGQLFELDLEESAGVYLLQVVSEGKKALVRLVKK